MPFEPGSRSIDVLPLKRGLIKSCLCGHVVRHRVQAQGLERQIPLFPSPKGSLSAAICKSQAPTFLQVCVTAPQWLYTCSFGSFGLIFMFLMKKQAYNKIVVQFLVEVKNEA